MKLLRQAIVTFEPRVTLLAVGRSALAIAQLTILLFNSDDTLFPATASADLTCRGIKEASIWCLAGSSSTGMLLARFVAFAILTAVASGYRPRWTCLPHWYVALSLNASLPVANGGEQVAQIVTMLLIPLCMRDERIWHWGRPTRPLPATWRGAAFASHLMIRAQASVIYLDAAASKLTVPEWREGTAVFTIANLPGYGFPDPLLRLVEPVLVSFPVVAAMTWGAVATEVLIGVLVLGRRRVRYWAMALGIALHFSIAISMGLASFQMIMIALLMIVCAPRHMLGAPTPQRILTAMPSSDIPRTRLSAR